MLVPLFEDLPIFLSGFNDLPLLRNKFEEDMIAWHRENANLPEYQNKPYAYQKAFDAEVKVLMGEILANSNFRQNYYDSYGIQIQNQFGLVIPRRDIN